MFIHLHTHSYYSFLAGLPSPQALAQQAARLAAQVEFEVPLVERSRIEAAVDHLLSPLVDELRPYSVAEVGLVPGLVFGWVEATARARKA